MLAPLEVQAAPVAAAPFEQEQVLAATTSPSFSCFVGARAYEVFAKPSNKHETIKDCFILMKGG